MTNQVILEVENSLTTLTAPREVCTNIANLLSYQLKDHYFLRKQILNKWRLGYAYKGMSSEKVNSLIDAMTWVHLYNKTTNKFPTGLLQKTLDHLKLLDVDYLIKDKRIKPRASVTFRKVSPLPHLRYYQSEAIDLALKKNRGILEMATGSGKTNVIVELIYKLGVNTLVIVPTSTILIQFYNILVKIFGKNKVGLITSGKKALNKPITIATYQSLPNIDKNWFEKIDCMMIDEAHTCFVGSTKIITDLGIKQISDLCNNKIKCKVKSYNIEKNEWEWKELIECYKYKSKQELLEIVFEHNGKINKVKCTTNHKIYTKNRGYVEAKDLTLEDDIITTEKYHCKYCNWTTESVGKKWGHVSKHVLTYEDKVAGIQPMLKVSRSPAQRKKSSERMKINNPMKNLETRNRMAISVKKAFWSKTEEERKKQVEIFVNAPKQGIHKGPTNIEQRIIDLKIHNVSFTGNGKYWLTSNKKHMNPDFKVKSIRKVIEVGDTAYWHTIHELKERIKNYKKINFKCLYLTNAYMDKISDAKLKNIIEGFINHG